MQYLFWFAVFFMVWWVGILAVLPWGVRTQIDNGSVVKGTSPSAPVRFKYKKVLFINTMLALFITFCIAIIVENPQISIRPLLKYIGAPVERNF